eukprot:SAG22_NODE_5646_length_978_cov_1.263936_1_plen_124_part_10
MAALSHSPGWRLGPRRALAQKELPGSWRTKLAESCAEIAAREAAGLALSSRAACEAVGERVVQEQLRAALAAGAFDGADGAAALTERTGGVVRAYEAEAAGPAKESVLAAAVLQRGLGDTAAAA